MKQSEFLRWLKSQGVEISQGSKHIWLEYNGKCAAMPRHPSHEMPTGTAQVIKKQLGLK